MRFNRRLFLLRYLLLSIVGVLAPLIRSKSSSAQTAYASVYGIVPGLAAGNPDINISARYKVEVRDVLENGGRGIWLSVPAYETKSKANAVPAGLSQQADLGYYMHLKGWTHTFGNFQMQPGRAVEVRISSINSTKITKAVVHPERAPATSRMEGGAVIVKLTNPCLIAVDINGQMDDVHTGKGYTDPAIHTISIFANPPIDVPTVNIVRKAPNSGIPTLTSGQTLVFDPGIHIIQSPTQPSPTQLKSNCNYYIPGDAIVYGTFNGDSTNGNTNIRIFGHGILSGARNRHPGYFDKDGFYVATEAVTRLGTTYQPGQSVPYIKDERMPLPQRLLQQATNDKYRAIAVNFAKNVKVEGITLVDLPQITISLTGAYEIDSTKRNYVRWVKMISWRENSDGILSSGNTEIEDCFIRNQDDSLGVGNPSIKRVVQWNDANGAAYIMSLEKLEKAPASRDTLIEDCDVIYSRCIFSGGGQVFLQNNKPGGRSTVAPVPVYGERLIFRNITIEDKQLSKAVFYMSLGDSTTNESTVGSVQYNGITFENVKIAKLAYNLDYVSTKPCQTIKGFSNSSKITNVKFINLMVDGTKVTVNLKPNTTTQIFARDNTTFNSFQFL